MFYYIETMTKRTKLSSLSSYTENKTCEIFSYINISELTFIINKIQKT